MKRSTWIVAAAAAIVISFAALPGAGSPAAAAGGGAVYLPNITKTLGGPSGWTTPLTVQNIGPAASVEEVALYRFADGALVTTIASPPLPPRASWTLDPLAYPALPDDTQFSAVVRPANGQAAAVVLEGSGASWMSYAGTTAGASTVYLPNVLRRLGGADGGDGWSTPFVVQNVGSAPTAASVLFYRFSDGGLAARIDNVALDPGRGRAFLPWTIGGLVDGGSYSVVVQGPADAQLWAIVNEHQGAQAMSYEGLVAGGERVYLPNVTKELGGSAGWSTPLVVQNLGPAPTTFTLAFYAFATGGLALRTPAVALDPGRASATDVRFAPAGLAAGQYGVVVEGPPGARLGAIVNEMDLGGARSMSYVGASAAQPSAYLPVVRVRTGDAGWVSPVIAQNLGTAASDVVITLFDAAGAVAAQRRFLLVPPGAAAVYEPQADPGLAPGTYSALVQAAVAVAAVTNQTATAVPGDYALAYAGTGGPAVPTPAAPAGVPFRIIGGTAFAVVAGQRADLYVEAAIATDRARLASAVDADVAQVETDYARRFALRPQLYYFATPESFAAGRGPVLGDTFTGAVGKQEGLFVAATGRIGFDWTTVSLTTARHELTHEAVFEIAGPAALPQWLNEGLARAEEYTYPAMGYAVARDQYGAASMAAAGGLLSLDALEAPLEWFARDGGPAADYQYAESAQAVRFLRADAGADAPRRIVALLGQGVPFGDAFAQVTGRSYASFGAAFPGRVLAIAPSYPGAVVTAGPDGSGLAFVLYGFTPLAPIAVTTDWNHNPTAATHSAGSVDAYGRWDQFVSAGSLAGTYTITAVGANGTVTLAATKP